MLRHLRHDSKSDQALSLKKDHLVHRQRPNECGRLERAFRHAPDYERSE
jgi:hypothetical protein